MQGSQYKSDLKGKFESWDEVQVLESTLKVLRNTSKLRTVLEVLLLVRELCNGGFGVPWEVRICSKRESLRSFATASSVFNKRTSSVSCVFSKSIFLVFAT